MHLHIFLHAVYDQMNNVSASVSQFGVGVEELLVYVVSWVGISVALVCLATCLTTLCCQGAPWHTDHSTIHCNLWANLLFTELLFLVGANKTQYTVSAWRSPMYFRNVLNWSCFRQVERKHPQYTFRYSFDYLSFSL